MKPLALLQIAPSTMTEYDYPPEALDQYLSQDRMSQWAGSSQRYPSQTGFVPSGMGDGFPFTPSIPYNDRGNSIYDQGGQYRHRRGRSPTRRPLNRSYQGQGGERYYPDQYNLDRDPTLTSFHNNGFTGSIAHPFASQHASANFPGSRRDEDSFPYTHSGMLDPHRHVSPSRHHYSRSSRYPSSNIQLLRSMSQLSRSRSSTPSSRDSTSSRSYSSRSRSYSPSRRSRYDHRVIHASTHSPTVIQPSRDHATVVPINGGAGGYVVVPAVGQRLKVVVSLHSFRLR